MYENIIIIPGIKFNVRCVSRRNFSILPEMIDCATLQHRSYFLSTGSSSYVLALALYNALRAHFPWPQGAYACPYSALDMD